MIAKLTEPIVPDCWGRSWHVYQREDGSITIYYTQERADAHFVVYDTLDNTFTDLLAALRPLAALWRDAMSDMPDDKPIWQLNEAIITVGDVKAARAAIAKAERGE